MEKLSLPLREVTSTLKMASELALDRWSRSVSGVVDGEVVEYLKQRVRFILHRIERGCAVELRHAEALFTEEDVTPHMLFLGNTEFQILKEGLTRALKEQIRSSGLEACDMQVAERQIDFVLRVLEDSLTASLLSTLFSQAEQVKQEKQSIRKSLGNITDILERDRQRLAFDLHDGPAQALSSALLQADMLEEFLTTAEAKEELASLKSILSQCLHELRTSIYSLKPQSTSQKGLVAKVEGYTRQLSTRSGLEIEVTVEPQERELPGVVEVNVFRIIQEALNNAVKHAMASRVTVTIVFTTSALTCTVEDNGIGLRALEQHNQTKELNGYGLISMRDRVEQFFGTFTVGGEPGRGTRVRFSIPL